MAVRILDLALDPLESHDVVLRVLGRERRTDATAYQTDHHAEPVGVLQRHHGGLGFRIRLRVVERRDGGGESVQPVRVCSFNPPERVDEVVERPPLVDHARPERVGCVLEFRAGIEVRGYLRQLAEEEVSSLPVERLKLFQPLVHLGVGDVPVVSEDIASKRQAKPSANTAMRLYLNWSKSPQRHRFTCNFHQPRSTNFSSRTSPCPRFEAVLRDRKLPSNFPRSERCCGLSAAWQVTSRCPRSPIAYMLATSSLSSGSEPG